MCDLYTNPHCVSRSCPLIAETILHCTCSSTCKDYCCKDYCCGCFLDCDVFLRVVTFALYVYIMKNK